MLKIASILILLCHFVSADVVLPAIFNHDMVLQRDLKAPIWGWAESGEAIEISFGEKTLKTTADAKGNWKVEIGPLSANSQGQKLSIKGKNLITLTNVLIGDVWICSGQSNMEWSVSGSDEPTKAAALSKKGNLNIRLFRVPNHIQAVSPLADVQGEWTTCNDVNQINNFSSVGFAFGHSLESELAIPIGLIDTSWGGTAIESWIPAEGYQQIGEPLPEINMAQLEAAKNDMKQTVANLDAWKLKAAMAEKNGLSLPSPTVPQVSHHSKNGIYNAMVAGMTPFAVKGAIWYQGESNRGRAYPDYFNKLKALIGGWRKMFTSEKLSFYIVQIAPYDYNRKQRSEKDQILCDTIWRTQFRAAEEIENCAIIPVHDTIEGNVSDIHPKNKLTVGQRLAALALKHDYGKSVITTGPVFDKAVVEGSKIIVHFKHVDLGLTTNDVKELKDFEVSMDGKTFSPAKAMIEGSTVVVQSESVATPKFVRMGWNEISIPNLADKNGWPARQFTNQPY